jgi:hypothetical protein
MLGATSKLMDNSIAVYASLEEMKAAELRERQALPAQERLRAVSELIAGPFLLAEKHLRWSAQIRPTWLLSRQPSPPGI